MVGGQASMCGPQPMHSTPLRVPQAQWCRALVHSLFPGHRDPRDPQGRRERMATLEGTVSQ